ncbi:FkbM family methyltransferase [Nisaea sp.]|uniref:FkbM family methyltransferase n=1 Tax=Nisaea sp. TaxID=2024842 RepID=UPI002B277364|nr:FkbM family methyltransferase [Nisaea sp.]
MNCPNSIFVNCLSTKFRYGKITFPAADRYLCQTLAECGDYCRGEVIVYERLLSKGDLVVDVGANIGAMALAFANAVGPAGSVRSFEASPFAFDLLRHNLDQNGVCNAAATRAIVSSTSGTARFVDPDVEKIDSLDFGSMSLSVNSERVPGRFVETQQVTLDGLALDQCNLIKIDVEGHEAAVVAGALDTISKFTPFLSIETGLEDDDLSWIYPLRELGYRIFILAYKVAAWPNFKGRNISDLTTEVSVNAVCIPPTESHFDHLGDIPRREVQTLDHLVAECRRYRKRARY